jgi:hypothetical protein
LVCTTVPTSEKSKKLLCISIFKVNETRELLLELKFSLHTFWSKIPKSSHYDTPNEQKNKLKFGLRLIDHSQ